jgi:hypothetical protein
VPVLLKGACINGRVLVMVRCSYPAPHLHGIEAQHPVQGF